MISSAVTAISSHIHLNLYLQNKFDIMTEGKFRYKQVVQKIEEIIINLQLKQGDKIPSVRRVSTDLHVSPCTVNQAYSILEAKGLIISCPRSGFYINELLSLKVGETIRKRSLPLTSLSVSAADGKTPPDFQNSLYHLDFVTSEPAGALIPASGINKALQASIRDTVSDIFQSPFPEGHPKLRRQIAIHTFDWKMSLRPEDVLITNGCLEAINLCLGVVAEPGDKVIVTSPVCPGILEVLRERGLVPLEIAVIFDQGLDLNTLEQLIDGDRIAACLLTTVCVSPAGSSMPDKEKLRLLELLDAKKIPLIEDDALGELHFDKQRPLAAKAYDVYDNVLYCSSFSKSLAPGFQIGWVAAGRYQEKIERLKRSVSGPTNSVLQDAVARFMENGFYQSHLKKLRVAVSDQVDKYRLAVEAGFPAGTRVSKPKGGFSLWIELPDHISSAAVQQAALAYGIKISSGPEFTATAAFEHCICINCSPLYNNRVESAIYKIGSIANSMRMLNAS
jgi:DNA-binding transcriptional MocR family regulator